MSGENSEKCSVFTECRDINMRILHKLLFIEMVERVRMLQNDPSFGAAVEPDLFIQMLPEQKVKMRFLPVLHLFIE